MRQYCFCVLNTTNMTILRAYELGTDTSAAQYVWAVIFRAVVGFGNVTIQEAFILNVGI